MDENFDPLLNTIRAQHTILSIMMNKWKTQIPVYHNYSLERVVQLVVHALRPVYLIRKFKLTIKRSIIGLFQISIHVELC